jgi:hypothetical protein
MANLNVTDLSDEVMQALTAKAYAAGFTDRLAYVRSLLNSNHPNGIGGGASNFSEEEFEAYKRAEDLIRRNGPGDREKAVAMLQSAFEDVVEIPA